MSEERLRRALREVEIPGGRDAEERALRMARAAAPASSGEPDARGRGFGRRGLQVALAVGLIAALVSPAGAAVRHFVRDAVETEHRPAQPALTSLPTSGSLLVDSPQGPWVVRADGSKRLLGAYAEATWSPHGLFVAATKRDELTAVDPEGEVRWTIARAGGIADPAWSPDGFRIAYLNGDQLRVIAGDGSGDRALVDAVSPVGPAWAPGAERALSFVDAGGSIRTLSVDTGEQLSRAPAPAGTRRLEWSRDGSRLLVVAPGVLQLRDRAGALVWRHEAPGGAGFETAAISPSGRDVAAVITTGAAARSELLSLGPGEAPRRLFSGLGRLGEVVYSPDGRWLLLSWRSADQWLFLNPAHPGRVAAVSDVSAQFDPGATSPVAFPRVAGWCCPPDR
jgi:dipeptidyl aminopeptidase/acylaminoacyl peptidase